MIARTVAERIIVTGVDAIEARAQVRDRARALGLLGWVRAADSGGLELHVEGPDEAVAALHDELAALGPDARFGTARAKREGHEQFAVRGVPAGAFVVQEHKARAHHYDLRLEVGGVMRSWAVPKGPSLDPAVKRFAVESGEHALDAEGVEGPLGDGRAIVWDRGSYERGGRVPWPEALARGHAVFVLHGEKLRGGFALQRTAGGGRPAWLLVKRRDDFARPGSDITAEAPASVRSGRRLDELG